MAVSFNYHTFIDRIAIVGVQAVHTPVFNTCPRKHRFKFPGNFLTMAACLNVTAVLQFC